MSYRSSSACSACPRGAEFVILSERAIDLRTVQRLIDLGVRRVVQNAGWPRPLRNAIEAARRYKLLS